MAEKTDAGQEEKRPTGKDLLDLCESLGKELNEDWEAWSAHRDKNLGEEFNAAWYNFLSQMYDENEETHTTEEGKDGRSKVFIGKIKNKITSIANKYRDFMFGSDDPPISIGPSPKSPMPKELAESRAKRMQEKIKDQLIETDYIVRWLTAFLTKCIFGTVIGKKNIIETEERFYEPYLPVGNLVMQSLGDKYWELVDKYGKFAERVKEKKLPVVDVWDIYCFCIDPKATGPQEGKGQFFDSYLEEHQVSLLTKNTAYFEEALKEILAEKAPKDNDYAGKKRDQATADKEKLECGGYRFSEYWGLIKKSWFKKLGVELQDQSPSDWVEGSATIAANGKRTLCVRLYENRRSGPYRGQRTCVRDIYEMVPLKFYGRGIWHNAKGEQAGINGLVRAMLDNKFQRVRPPIFYDEDYGADLPETYQSGHLYPMRGVNGQWEKVFKVMEFPDVGESAISAIRLLEEFLDEETVPKYSTGYGDQKTHRTLGGLSMLLGTANVNIKASTQNADLFWIEPELKFMYDFNMVYDDDPTIKGDFVCKALGVRSLMAKEVYLSQFLEFLRILGGSLITPLVQGDMELLMTLFAQLCEGMDLKDIKRLAEKRIEKLKASGVEAPGAEAPPTEGAGAPGPGPPGEAKAIPIRKAAQEAAAGIPVRP